MANNKTIAILDYGAGNLYSIKKALESLNLEVIITTHQKDILASNALVLPGVGAFKDALPTVTRISPALNTLLQNSKPVLGICLGMQLFFSESDEDGTHKGLNLVKGRIEHLPSNVKVPHMGWNTLQSIAKDPFTEKINEGDYVYFVHSYAPINVNPSIVLAYSNHGRKFPAIIRSGSLIGTQFHPEKSGSVGRQLLDNFVSLL